MDLSEYQRKVMENKPDPHAQFVGISSFFFKFGILANFVREHREKKLEKNPYYMRGREVALEFNSQLESSDQTYLQGIWDGWNDQHPYSPLAENHLYQQGRDFAKRCKELAAVAVEEELKLLEEEYERQAAGGPKL